MDKVLELESNPDSTKPAADSEERKKNDIEQMIERTMKKAYIYGLSNGVKTMCVQLLAKMKENKNLNPQKRLLVLKQFCQSILNQEESNQTNNSTNTTNTEKGEM